MEVASTKSDRHLPADLLHEILRRLPVKSLLRFRCVSKPWLALVDDDADFARLHLDTFKNNRDQTRLFVVEGRQRDCTVRCADTFEPIFEIPSCLCVDKPGDPFMRWQIVSSVDGLVLLELRNVLKLWNPSLRHFHIVPPAPIDVAQRRKVIGLGYDPVGKDYKIVMLIKGFRSGSGVLSSVAIYTVGTDSWKTIALQGKEGSSCSERQLGECRSARTVYLHGSLYFFAWARDKNNFGLWDLMAFDLNKEVYSCISTPCEFDDNWYFELVLIDGGSSLALRDKRGTDKFIWVLERESMNWTKRDLCNLKIYRLLCGKKNGDMLITRWINETREWNEELASYNPAKHEYKIVQRRSLRRSFLYCTVVSFYVESLILNKLNRV